MEKGPVTRDEFDSFVKYVEDKLTTTRTKEHIELLSATVAAIGDLLFKHSEITEAELHRCVVKNIAIFDQYFAEINDSKKKSKGN